jgi:3-methylcrotonyl-CoA carboxylase beta subunit
VAILESKVNRNEAFERQAEHWRGEAERLREEEETIRLGGGLKAQDKQRAQGKMTARERVEALCDPGAPFLELGLWAAHGFYEEYGGAPAAGVVVGIGAVHGRDMVVVSNDATVKAGAWFPMTCKKVLRAQEIALENRLPIVYLVDSAGVFLPMQDEIFPDKEHFGRAFYNNARLSAEGIFQMAAIMGSCVAGGAYLPIMSDESHIVEGTGSIFLAGSHLVQAAIGEKIGNEELGGALVQCDISGVVDHRHPDDASCLAKIRSQLQQLAVPETAPFARRAPAAPLYDAEDLYGIMPVDRSRPYDTREILARLLDGVIYSDSADKAARFVELCNQKKIPLLFLQDVTGFMVGSRAERGGIIKDGAKMVNAVANSTVPKVTLFVGNSYGAGNYAMCGKAYGPRFLYAWPSAAIAVMGGDQASRTLLSIQLKNRGADVSEEEKTRRLAEIKARYAAAMNPRYAAARLWVDAIIDPARTRGILARSFAAAAMNPHIPEFRTGVLQT